MNDRTPDKKTNSDGEKAQPTSVWQYVEEFESDLQIDRQLNLCDYFPPQESKLYEEVVSEILRIKIEFDWQNGKQNSLPELFKQIPELIQQKKVVADAAYEDYRQHRIFGIPVTSEDYEKRFGVDIASWSTITSESEPNNNGSFYDPNLSNVVFPEPGDTFGRFEIVAELGRGAFGRVFIARQIDLADRLIALKITKTPMHECQRLARLQHANIMPVYSVHQVGELFAICMPLLGMATLKDVVDVSNSYQSMHQTQNVAHEKRKSVFVEAMERGRMRVPVDVLGGWQREILAKKPGIEHQDSLIDFFNKSSHNRSVLQTAHQISRGLNHAHTRRILHRDIKPANVLLATDGTPLLLDFNLGSEWQDQEKIHHTEPEHGFVGGTLVYMAPEHIEAMETNQVDLVTTQSDVYSVGVIMYQLLTGRFPHQFRKDSLSDLKSAIEIRQKPIVSPRHWNAKVTSAEESIVLKCLAFDQADRYQSANELSIDIRRQLNYQPLIYAKNRSTGEGIQKFFRRNPQLISIGSVGFAAIFLLLIAAVTVMHFFVQFQRQQSLEVMRDFTRSLHHAEGSLFFPDGGSHAVGLDRAEEALAHYRVMNNPNWRNSYQFQYLSEGNQKRVERQVALLVMLMESGANRDDINGEASLPEHLKSIRAWVSRNPDALDKSDQPILSATNLYEDGEFQEAITVLEEAIEEAPQRFVLWFLKGRCHYGKAEYRRANHCFAMASIQDKSSAISALSRAKCHYQLKEDDFALEQLETAQQLDSSIAGIYAIRAKVYQRQKQFQMAIRQLDVTLKQKPDTARYLLVRSQLRREVGDIGGAETDLKLALNSKPTDPESWIMRGNAQLADNPEAALADFRQASHWESTRVTAYQQMAWVLSERLNRTDEAIDVLTKLLEEQPDCREALVRRAALNVRHGNIDKATKDLDQCVKADLTPQLNYQIAGVYSQLLAQVKNEEQRHKFTKNAIRHLSSALRSAYGIQQMATDNDLKDLRSTPEFQAIQRGVDVINQNSN